MARVQLLLALLACAAARCSAVVLPSVPADGATSCYTGAGNNTFAPSSMSVLALTTGMSQQPAYAGLVPGTTGVCSAVTFICNAAMGTLLADANPLVVAQVAAYSAAARCGTNSSNYVADAVTYTLYAAFPSAFLASTAAGFNGLLATPYATNLNAVFQNFLFTNVTNGNWVPPSPPPPPPSPPPPPPSPPRPPPPSPTAATSADTTVRASLTGMMLASVVALGPYAVLR